MTDEEIAALAAERDRYEAALEHIVEICDQPVDATVEALRIARRALNDYDWRPHQSSREGGTHEQ